MTGKENTAWAARQVSGPQRLPQRKETREVTGPQRNIDSRAAGADNIICGRQKDPQIGIIFKLKCFKLKHKVTSFFNITPL